MTEAEKLVRAVLVNIVEDGGYLVCRVPSMPGESVTVSHRNWSDGEPPRIGTDVVLIGTLVRHRQGWRANEARYLRPTDRL